MTRKVAFSTAGVLLVAAFALLQGLGRLEGVAKDSQGLVLPGVTVTLTGTAVMGARVATAEIDGSYRFHALPPGSYDLVFELLGFQTLKREGVVVATGSTFTIDVELPIATLTETITVIGGSPLIDLKATGVGATFDTQELEEVPSATDMWAVLQQTPGIRMAGFDVGGSHKSQQTGYDSFGVRDQNRIVNEGVNTTEGAGWSGGYVRKQTRNNWVGSGTASTINLAQTPERLTQNLSLPCNGCPSGFEGTTLHLRTLPDGAELEDLQVANAVGDTDGNYDTVQLAFNQRFRKDFFLNASFDYQWRSEMRAPSASDSPLDTDPIAVYWDPGFNRDIGLRQDTNYWSFKSAARYVAAREIGLAATVRVQSGFPWAPIHYEDLPSVGTVGFFLEDLKNNRSETVAIVDFRADKAFTFGERYKLTVMADVFNLLNTNAETNFLLLTGSDYGNIIEWISGRTLKVGLRLQF